MTFLSSRNDFHIIRNRKSRLRRIRAMTHETCKLHITCQSLSILEDVCSMDARTNTWILHLTLIRILSNFSHRMIHTRKELFFPGPLFARLRKGISLAHMIVNCKTVVVLWLQRWYQAPSLHTIRQLLYFRSPARPWLILKNRRASQ